MSKKIAQLTSFRSSEKQIIRLLLLITLIITAFINNVSGQYQMEKLNRGIVAVKTSDTSVFISWRLLATDPDTVAFNVYRGNTRINNTLGCICVGQVIVQL
jgi:hypothetical protein